MRACYITWDYSRVCPRIPSLNFIYTQKYKKHTWARINFACCVLNFIILKANVLIKQNFWNYTAINEGRNGYRKALHFIIINGNLLAIIVYQSLKGTVMGTSYNTNIILWRFNQPIYKRQLSFPDVFFQLAFCPFILSLFIV